MPRLRALALLLGLVLLGTFSSTQCLSRNDVYAQIGTAFTWAVTAQASWNGDHTLVSCSDFFTYVKNDSSSCTTLYGSNGAHQMMNWAQMQQHAVNTVPSAHTPILANNSFAGASFASWLNDSGNTCTWNASSTQAQDADGGSAFTAAPLTSSCSGGFNQPFNIPGASAPTSQSLSFYYMAPLALAGDPVNCTQGSGTVVLTVKVNGTTVPMPPITYASSWQPVTLTIGSDLVAGSNTIDISASATSASGTQLTPPNNLVCNTQNHSAQSVYIDNVSLTATY